MGDRSDFDFECLYARYPRKEGKRQGMDKLRRMIRTQAEYESFATAVDNYIQLCHDERRDRKYVKLWSTFVNNYTDYICEMSPALSGNEAQIERILRGEI